MPAEITKFVNPQHVRRARGLEEEGVAAGKRGKKKGITAG